MIIEYTKPWNFARVWLDTGSKTVIFKENLLVLRYKYFCKVKQTGLGTFSLTGEETDPDKRIAENIQLARFSETEEVLEALEKAFDGLDRENHPFLCPTCTYGQFFRVCHEPPNYGEPQYLCKDLSKKRETPGVLRKSERLNKEISASSVKFPTEDASSFLDYENGPGGWDGKNCKNYREKNAGGNWSLTNNGLPKITFFQKLLHFFHVHVKTVSSEGVCYCRICGECFQ